MGYITGQGEGALVSGAMFNTALFLLAVAATAALAWALVPLAVKLGLVDRPGECKFHAHSTPMTGGPAIFLVLAVFSAWQFSESPFFVTLAGGCAVLCLIGLLDDARGLSPSVRFVVQALACLLVLQSSGVKLEDFGSLLWNAPLELGVLAVPVTLFSALGVINAYNMIDGMDGLAAIIFVITSAGLALLAAIAGHMEMTLYLLIAIGTVVGFMLLNLRLPWNPKARIFLGDAGSLLLGFILAWCLIKEGSGPERALSPMTAVWLIAVPLLDTSTLICMRWREGKSAFEADQYHLHHAFMRVGYSVQTTWLAVTAVALFFAVVGLLMEFAGVADYLSFYLFMVLAFIYYFYMKDAWAKQRFLGMDFIYQDFVVEDAWAIEPPGDSEK